MGKLKRASSLSAQPSIIIAKQAGKLTAQFFEGLKDKEGQQLSEEQILKMLSGIKNNDVKSISFSGEDTCFTIGNVKITLANREAFKNDSNFAFIMAAIKKKSYQLQRIKRVLKPVFKAGFALTLASVIGFGSYALSKNVNSVDFSEPQVTYTDADKVEEVKEAVSTQAPEPTTEEATTPIITESKTKEPTKVAVKKVDKNSPSYKLALNKSLLNVCGTLKDSNRVNYVRENYGSIIQKYCNMYLLDPEIIISMAAQERGVHSSRMDKEGAMGLMQIQVSTAYTAKLSVHNYETNKNDVFAPSENYKYSDFMNKLGDVDYNIKFGCAVFKYHMNKCNNNVIAALQSYNMGEETMNNILKRYSSATGRSVSQILNDSSDLGWLNYTNGYPGDSKYVNHVLRYYNGNPVDLSIGTNEQSISQGRAR